jgi:DNA-binding NarL/FixJ family response regulator
MNMRLGRNRALSQRERQVIALAADGLTTKDIGLALGVSRSTVKQCLHHIYDKTGMGNRVELALWYEARRPTARTRKAA